MQIVACSQDKLKGSYLIKPIGVKRIIINLHLHSYAFPEFDWPTG